MNPIKRNIANTVTCCNVLCGTLAILFMLLPTGLTGCWEPWLWGSLFIAIAAVADFSDGLVARAAGVTGPLGKELDSLSDLVSFGVAPCVLLCHALLDAGSGIWPACIAALIPVAGALRLAKFNIDTRQTTSFLGLPIPANAIFWIGYVAVMKRSLPALAEWWAYIPTIIVLCALMVCELPMVALKFKNYGWKGNQFRWLLIAGIVALLILFGIYSLMWVIVWYVAVSIAARAAHSI